MSTDGNIILVSDTQNPQHNLEQTCQTIIITTCGDHTIYCHHEMNQLTYKITVDREVGGWSVDKKDQ